jgi:hypothetical protein
MSAQGVHLATFRGIPKGRPVFLYKNRASFSGFELEDPMEAKKLDHGLDLGLQSLQNDFAGIFRKAAQDAQQETDARTVDEIHIRHLDFGMNKGIFPKRPDLLLKLRRPACIEASPQNFKSDGFAIGMRIKESFHRWPTYIRTSRECKWRTPEIALGLSLP